MSAYSLGVSQGVLFPEAEAWALETTAFRRVVTTLEPARPGTPLEADLIGRPIRRPGDAARALAPHLEHEAVEVFAALPLNSRHEVIGYVEVSRGTLNRSLVHPREVLGPAVRLGAAAVIVAHNHPSGDPAPSAEDREVTTRLRSAGEVLGIPLIDHVVIGEGGRHASLRMLMSWTDPR
jgi:DNA repair protein RadC